MCRCARRLDFDDKQGCLCYLSLTIFGWVEIVEFGCGMDI